MRRHAFPLRRYRYPRTFQQFAAMAVEYVRRRPRSICARGADALERRSAARLADLFRPCLRAGLLGPFARRLGASAERPRRELGGCLDLAVAAGDVAGALRILAAAARGPDRRAEKIVSHRYRFVWICNPKAASRSLIVALTAADPEAVLVRELTLEQVHARYPDARSYFSFAFVRHPADRVRSFHLDKHVRAQHSRAMYIRYIRPYPGLRLGMTFAELCRWLATPCGADAFADRHWLSQWRQIADADERLPDFVGRCERLEEDWGTVSAHLGLPATALSRLHAHRPDCHRHSAEDAGIDALLRRRYRRDYEIGGYGGRP